MSGVLDLCERDEGLVIVHQHLGHLLHGLLIWSVSCWGHKH